MKYKLKILLMFIVIMGMSFIPESNHELFGDWLCKGGVSDLIEGNHIVKGCTYHFNTHNPTWHWGFRHWTWVFMGLTFCIWTVAETINENNK